MDLGYLIENFHFMLGNETSVLSPTGESTSDSSQASSDGGAPPIPAYRLVATLLGPLILLTLSRLLQLDLEKKLLIGLMRSSGQLLLLGLVLLNFIFSINSMWLVLFYLLMMITIASVEVNSRHVRTYEGHSRDSLIACALGGGLVGLYASLVIFHPTPWWNPRVMIPTAGMIIGNSVSGPAVSVERLLSEIDDKRHESETRLAFGASSYESVLPVVKASIQAALLPTLNQMAIMGLVSIPGMMTGQLLGGAKPFTASEYQIAILYLLVTTSTIATFTSVVLAIRHAVFDKEHRLTPHKIIKRHGKKELDAALLQAFLSIFLSLFTFMKQILHSISHYFSYFSSHPTPSGEPRPKTHRTIYAQLPSELDQDGEVELSAMNPLSKGSIPLEVHEELDHDGSLLSRAKYEVSITELPQIFPLKSQNDHYLLNIQNLNVMSGGNKSLLAREEGFNLQICRGERIAIEGPSGIGKTRLLRAISQLDPPLSGTIEFLEPSKTFHQWTMPIWRSRVLYVPQALPPLNGTPKDFILECCLYKSRKNEKGTISLKLGKKSMFI